jgi:hypothetical protein
MNSATVGAGKFLLFHFCLGPEFLVVGERDRKYRSSRSLMIVPSGSSAFNLFRYL